MGHLNTIARATALALIAMSSVTTGGTGASAATQPKPAAAPAKPLTATEQKQKDADASRRNYESGVKAFQAGKYQPAVDDLSAALRGGGLASPDMARALYVRGMAYKKQSKPGLAISDLTSALWLKNGLNDSDRQNATAERAEAYRLAGLGDGNSGAETVAVADPNAAPAPPIPATAASAPPIPVAAATPAPTGKKLKKGAVAAKAPEPVPAPAPEAQITRQSPDSEAAKDAARARKLASQSSEDNSFQAAASRNLVNGSASAKAAAPEPTPAVVPAPAPMAQPVVTAAAPAVPVPAPAPQLDKAAAQATAPVLAAAPNTVPAAVPAPSDSTTPKTSVAGFFSNLFNGNTATPASEAPQVTAATTPAASVPVAPSVTSALPSAAPKVAGSAPVKTGKYKVHIAALRSRAEAEAMAQQIVKQHGPALNNHSPQVDEAVIGSMGTFYRVRVVGYADANEPRTVCNTLRSSGFDCLVVTN